jgi:hypothetical protein
MNGKQLGLGLVLADFSALTAYAVYQYGFVGVYEIVFSNAVTITLFADLCIALTMVLAWMWRDARDRGWNVVPYALLLLAFGSVGPLLYLMRRVGAEASRPAHALPRAARAQTLG